MMVCRSVLRGRSKLPTSAQLHLKVMYYSRPIRTSIIEAAIFFIIVIRSHEANPGTTILISNQGCLLAWPDRHALADHLIVFILLRSSAYNWLTWDVLRSGCFFLRLLSHLDFLCWHIFLSSDCGHGATCPPANFR